MKRLPTLVAIALNRASHGDMAATDAEAEAAVKTVADYLLSKMTVNNQDILLAAGEMSAQELRTAKAVLAWMKRKLEAAAQD